MSKKLKVETYQHSDNGLGGQYKNWFLDYASYVILERAVPAIEDGLKPVQRRILYALKEMDDGRFNKVANIIGQSMQYHPHGDASIGDALVNMGQKNLLLDIQGNWGDARTGDEAAAPRYIEARLSKFALEVLFNTKTTQWQLSYDGRKKEPITLPAKFPLLLAQGAEGIAVGLSTKILPHNFMELIEASVKYLKNKKFELYPDFLTGGSIDVSGYADGARGGRVKVRADIAELDKKSLIISSVPYGITTGQLIESIVKANDQGKIKIKKVTDQTAANVEIIVELAPGVSPDITIDALYAFTDCEVSISPNACVIFNETPAFMGVSDLLKYSVEHTKNLLKKELELQLQALEEKWHFTSLEKIFFEEKIYQELEKKYATWDDVLVAIEKDFKPYEKQLKQPVTRQDVEKLTEKPVRRIYKADIDELRKSIEDIEAQITATQHHLNNLVEYTITYYENLKQKYGVGRERKTTITSFETIEVKQVAIPNIKIYANFADGFIGTSLKRDTFITEVSEFDDMIAFTKAGIMKVVKVADKVFIGKDILYVGVFRKNDERTTYNTIYVDGATGTSYAKRFNVTGVTREKEYNITKGSDKSKVLYFSVNANGEAEVVKVILSPNSKAKKKELDFYFEELDIKGRGAMGNQVTKYAIKTVKFKEPGQSTLGAKKLWFDSKFGRLSEDEKDVFLGSFAPEDKLLVFYKNGTYEMVTQQLTQKFDVESMVLIEKFKPQHYISLVYLDADKKQYNAKRFLIETSTLNQLFLCIKEGNNNELIAVSSEFDPVLEVTKGKGEQVTTQKFALANLMEPTSSKAIGTRLLNYEKNLKFNWDAVTEVPDSEEQQGTLF